MTLQSRLVDLFLESKCIAQLVGIDFPLKDMQACSRLSEELKEYLNKRINRALLNVPSLSLSVIPCRKIVN